MKFSDFFEAWLNDSYYANGVKIGKEGDFYTAVSVGSFFGICLGREILRLSANFADKISLVEIGANEGFLLADIAQALFTFDQNSLAKFEFVIIEPHERLRQIQSENFAKKFGDEITLKHLSSLKEAKFSEAIFIANELFDTFKCEVVKDGKMLYIEDFKQIWREICDNEIVKFGAGGAEIPLGYEEFASSINAQKFAFLAFDYGKMGASGEISLRIYKNHQVYNFFEIQNLAEFYGVSDITYNVDFEILAHAFENTGAKIGRFMSFEKALIEFGATQILEQFAQNLGQNGYQNALAQFNHLRHEFGEKFKFIEFLKGF